YVNQRRYYLFRIISYMAEHITKKAPITTLKTKVARTRKAIFHRLSPFMSTHNKDTPPKAIFFDAAGTLFHLPRGVGYHYALVGENIGLKLDSRQLDRAFNNAWNAMPRRESIDGPRENDDKDWWRQLVALVLNEVAPSLNELDRDNFFEIAYEHFAEAGVWELYPEVLEVLERLSPRFQLAVISNFDGRLRLIFEQLGISKFFIKVFLLSELVA